MIYFIMSEGIQYPEMERLFNINEPQTFRAGREIMDRSSKPLSSHLRTLRLNEI